MVFRTGHTIARWEAAVFLGYYVAYAGYLIPHAAEHGLASQLGAAIIWFVAPITVRVLRDRRADTLAVRPPGSR